MTLTLTRMLHLLSPNPDLLRLRGFFQAFFV
jgi:hypothetical protein